MLHGFPVFPVEFDGDKPEAWLVLHGGNSGELLPLSAHFGSCHLPQDTVTVAAIVTVTVVDATAVAVNSHTVAVVTVTAVTAGHELAVVLTHH